MRIPILGPNPIRMCLRLRTGREDVAAMVILLAFGHIVGLHRSGPRIEGIAPHLRGRRGGGLCAPKNCALYMGVERDNFQGLEVMPVVSLEPPERYLNLFQTRGIRYCVAVRLNTLSGRCVYAGQRTHCTTRPVTRVVVVGAEHETPRTAHPVVNRPRGTVKEALAVVVLFFWDQTEPACLLVCVRQKNPGKATAEKTFTGQNIRMVLPTTDSVLFEIDSE